MVLFMHWSGEYTGILDTPQISYVKHLLKGASIDLIVGSHPHTTHQHFYVNKTLVASSLGNLLFPSHYSCSRVSIHFYYFALTFLLCSVVSDIF